MITTETDLQAPVEIVKAAEVQFMILSRLAEGLLRMLR